MLYSLRDRFKRFRFARACAEVVELPPTALDPTAEVVVVTQLQHKDVLLALLAFKSFAARIPVATWFIVDDGSLTSEDIALLEAHAPGMRLLGLEEIRTPDCPLGGTWERLLWIARLTRDHYVVQLDSDTLTLAPLPEVQACVTAGHSFVIGTWDGQKMESMAFRSSEAHRYLSNQKDPHVQLLAEASLDKLSGAPSLRYARGCSGFSGFARQSIDLDFIKTVSREMRSAIGNAWDGWGSEQVMSNIVVANAPDAVVLPHPKYCDCTRIRPDATAFVHFIGGCRFVGNTYQTMAHRFIGEAQRRSPRRESEITVDGV